MVWEQIIICTETVNWIGLSDEHYSLVALFLLKGPPVDFRSEIGPSKRFYADGNKINRY